VPAGTLEGWDSDADLAGLVEVVEGGRLALTLRGRLLTNEVSLRLKP
jgi:hypothetical protein